jgi:RNA polymerase sigma-70 factor (ECF subfamily)
LSEDGIGSLVERARSGDAAAFGEIFRLYEGDVVRTCRRFLGSDGAEDAAAEVFLRARRGLAGHRPQEPLRPWLLGIAGNHCIDLLRRRKVEAALFDAGPADEGALASPAPSPLQYALRREERERVAHAVDALPERYRVPLALRYFADLDYGEIAQILGVERGQVATLLFRARRTLRARLAGGGGEGA